MHCTIYSIIQYLHSLPIHDDKYVAYAFNLSVILWLPSIAFIIKDSYIR